MKLAKTLLILFTIAFLLPTALAQVEGASFHVQSNIQNPTLCTCGEIVDQVEIVNTGIYDATYTISTNIEASIGQSQVVVRAGESQKIPILISGSCNSESFQENYEVTVNSNIAGEQTLERTLNQVECQTIDATLYTSNDTVGPCEPFNYTISLTNPSTFTETYNLTSNQEAITIENQTFTVESGQTVLQNATANFTCDVYGTQNVNFHLQSQKSQLEATLTHNLEIDRNYNFTMDSPDYGMCKFEESFRAITITNNKHFTNNYTLQLQNAPRQLTLRNNTIEVGPQSSELIYVDIGSIERDRQGTFRLLATSERGQVQRHIDIGYRTRNCYDLDMQFTTDQTNYCPGEHETNINITNKGEANTYFLESNQGLSQNEVTLQQNETTTITAMLNNENQEGIQELTQTINATPQNTSTKKDISISKDLSFYSQQACTQPQITNNIKTAYNKENITLTLENTGIRQTRYLINSQNTPNFLQTINTSTVLQPNQQDTLTLQLNTNQDDIGDYEFTTTITSNQNNQVYTETINLQITNKPALERLSETITNSNCAPITLITLILAALLLLGVITARIGQKKYNKGKTIGALFILIAITLIIAAIAFGAPILSYDEANTITVNNQTTLLMQDVFENQTNATYEVIEQPQGFTINITNTQATITRNQDFEGTNQVRFQSTSNNQTQISLPYLLTTNQNDISLYELNCGWINTTIIILSLLLLIFLPGKNKQEKQEKQNTDEEIKTPNKNSTKKEMKKYLDKKGVKYKSSDLKKDLYEKVQNTKK